jgi:YidC/Oxa1 family membrane protein insertase
MAEPNNGGTPGGRGQPKKELSMELRLLIAFILMGVVLFVTPYFYKGVAPPKKTGPVATKTELSAPGAPAPEQPTVPSEKSAPAAVESAPAAPSVAAQNEQLYAIDTDLFRISFSNRGGVVKSWLLKKFKASAGGPLELINPDSHADLPFALYFPGPKPDTDLNQALFQAKADPDGLGISFDYSNGTTVVHKLFRFRRASYLVDISTEVTNGGNPVPNSIEWRGGFGDLAVANPSGVQQTLYYQPVEGKLVKTTAKAAKNGPVTASGDYSFAGIEDTYFVAAFLPERATPIQVTTFTDTARTPFEPKELPFAGVAVGDGAVDRFSVYIGPKDIDVLRSVNPKLVQVVDFGWFGFLAKPLFLIVNWVTEHALHNYGWSIILVTVALNFMLFPLKVSSMKSMKKMQALQPQIAAINEKYKNIGLRDPRKAEQNQEVMELYKKHGVNPMGGCVPMLLQIPFFIAFYKVFSVSVEMRGASWLWVTDLSQPEHLPIKILPIVMVVTQFVMQKMTPTTAGTDPNQQRMMMFMPLIFGFMFYNLSSGLVLYYLTSNLVGIAQQWFFNRTSIAAVAAQSVQPPPKKKTGRK